MKNEGFYKSTRISSSEGDRVHMFLLFFDFHLASSSELSAQRLLCSLIDPVQLLLCGAPMLLLRSAAGATFSHRRTRRKRAS